MLQQHGVRLSLSLELQNIQCLHLSKLDVCEAHVARLNNYTRQAPEPTNIYIRYAYLESI